MTPQQQAAIAAGVTDSICIDAVAGSGKTTTLVGLSKAAGGTPLFLAFNVSVKKELESRVTGKCLTLNGLGHRLWGRAVGRLTLDAKKLTRLAGAAGAPYDLQYEVARTVESAMASCASPTSHDLFASIISDNDYSSECLPYISPTFSAAILEAKRGTIDFNDQLYMPVMFPCPKDPHDLVIVDEAQDLSPIQHKLIRKVYRSHLVAAGDPYQAIYGFRGAMEDSMSRLTEDYALHTMPLTVSFRCPRAVIAEAQRYVPHIEAREGAPEGIVDHALRLGPLDDGAAVICRTNAPLIQLAFRLLRDAIPFTYTGNDISERVTKLLRKWRTHSIEEANELMLAWRDDKLSEGRDWAEDIYLSYLAAVETTGAKTTSELYTKLRELAASEGSITLSTIHKAKGREWDHVHLLEGTPRDKNLAYVAITRAKAHLTYVGGL